MKIKSISLVFFFCMTAMVHAQNTDALLHAADSLSGQPEKALELLQQALAQNPDSEEVLKIRAEVYESMKQYDKAIADYKSLTRISPDEESLWYLLGRTQYKAGSYQDAIKSLNRATKLNPQYLPAFHVKIQALLSLNKNEQALKVSDSTLAVGETAMNYYLQGEVNKKLNARQKAEWAYAKATRIDKGFIEAYIALSDMAAGMNKAEETLVNADAALGINPDSEDALIARSRGFSLLKQYDDAIEDASYVIKLNPSNLSAYYWRGMYYKEKNKFQEAIKDFDHVLQAQPSNWQALVGRADGYAGLGDKKSALADYQKLQVEAANHPEKTAIVQLADQRIFELNRENHAPQVTLLDMEPDKFDIQIPDNETTMTLKGKITDESPIGKLSINGQVTPVTRVGDNFEFVALIKLGDIKDINIEVADVYDNINKLTYHLVKTETTKPQIVLFTPKAENGMVTFSDNEATLYVEGKITDQSTITSIVVEGKAVDFDHNATDPTFSAIIDINNKNQFSIVVTDSFGNTTEQTYTINRIPATAENNTSPTPAQIPSVEEASQ